MTLTASLQDNLQDKNISLWELDKHLLSPCDRHWGKFLNEYYVSSKGL